MLSKISYLEYSFFFTFYTFSTTCSNEMIQNFFIYTFIYVCMYIYFMKTTFFKQWNSSFNLIACHSDWISKRLALKYCHNLTILRKVYILVGALNTEHWVLHHITSHHNFYKTKTVRVVANSKEVWRTQAICIERRTPEEPTPTEFVVVL